MPSPKIRKKPTNKRCEKGFPCKTTCISRAKNCRKPLKWQAETFALWLKAQEERLAITNQKRERAGLAPAQLTEHGYITADRTRVSPSENKAAIASPVPGSKTVEKSRKAKGLSDVIKQEVARPPSSLEKEVMAEKGKTEPPSKTFRKEKYSISVDPRVYNGRDRIPVEGMVKGDYGVHAEPESTSRSSLTNGEVVVTHIPSGLSALTLLSDNANYKSKAERIRAGKFFVDELIRRGYDLKNLSNQTKLDLQPLLYAVKNNVSLPDAERHYKEQQERGAIYDGRVEQSFLDWGNRKSVAPKAAIAPATPKDSSSVSAKSARSRIGKAKTEAEVKSLISQAKREAEQEVTNYKKAIADLYREAIKGISGLETSEAKQEYYQKMNKESQKIADQAMNRFFELTPYRSKIGYDDAPDGMHDKLLLSSAEGAKAWHNGKIRAIGNTGRKFASDLHDALFNPTLKKSKAVTKTKSKASGETTNGDRPSHITDDSTPTIGQKKGKTKTAIADRATQNAINRILNSDSTDEVKILKLTNLGMKSLGSSMNQKAIQSAISFLGKTEKAIKHSAEEDNAVNVKAFIEATTPSDVGIGFNKLNDDIRSKEIYQSEQYLLSKVGKTKAITQGNRSEDDSNLIRLSDGSFLDISLLNESERRQAKRHQDNTIKANVAHKERSEFFDQDMLRVYKDVTDPKLIRQLKNQAIKLILKDTVIGNLLPEKAPLQNRSEEVIAAPSSPTVEPKKAIAAPSPNRPQDKLNAPKKLTLKEFEQLQVNDSVLFSVKRNGVTDYVKGRITKKHESSIYVEYSREGGGVTQRSEPRTNLFRVTSPLEILPEKSIKMMRDAIASVDINKLEEMLHTGNRSWRKMFEQSEGITLPKTIQGTHNAIADWARQRGVQKTSLDNEPKAIEEMPDQWADYIPRAKGLLPKGERGKFGNVNVTIHGNYAYGSDKGKWIIYDTPSRQPIIAVGNKLTAQMATHEMLRVMDGKSYHDLLKSSSLSEDDFYSIYSKKVNEITTATAKPNAKELKAIAKITDTLSQSQTAIAANQGNGYEYLGKTETEHPVGDDGDKIVMEYRLRPTTSDDFYRDSPISMGDKFILEKRRSEIFGGQKQDGDWAIAGRGKTKKDALMGVASSSDFRKMKSEHPDVKMAIDEYDQGRSKANESAKSKQRASEVESARKTLRGHQNHLSLLREKDPQFKTDYGKKERKRMGDSIDELFGAYPELASEFAGIKESLKPQRGKVATPSFEQTVVTEVAGSKNNQAIAPSEPIPHRMTEGNVIVKNYPDDLRGDTIKEYLAKGDRKNIFGDTLSPRSVPAYQMRFEDYKEAWRNWRGDQGYTDDGVSRFNLNYKKAIDKAIAEGKSIHPDIMKDYNRLDLSNYDARHSKRKSDSKSNNQAIASNSSQLSDNDIRLAIKKTLDQDPAKANDSLFPIYVADNLLGRTKENSVYMGSFANDIRYLGKDITREKLAQAMTSGAKSSYRASSGISDLDYARLMDDIAKGNLNEGNINGSIPNKRTTTSLLVGENAIREKATSVIKKRLKEEGVNPNSKKYKEAIAKNIDSVAEQIAASLVADAKAYLNDLMLLQKQRQSGMDILTKRANSISRDLNDLKRIGAEQSAIDLVQSALNKVNYEMTQSRLAYQQDIDRVKQFLDNRNKAIAD